MSRLRLDSQTVMVFADPTQSPPPMAGGGLSPALVRVRVPFSQVESQSTQVSHSDHSPFTNMLQSHTLIT
ncbi:hypothetical protein DPMN_114405 [Dreissena polymorpha]|uniref:Uncharacterized protein n=1 Tax=Dreissena polymorpha TaxID=45954 RepID=A0A9D4QRI8_DREPO|nr:hypothetical protein DPMN_114405 [Dreissena polymorpha]